MEQVNCNLCGANDPRPFLTTRDRYTGEEYHLWRCGNCHLIYLNPRPGADELERHYPDDYEAYQAIGPQSSALANWHEEQALTKRLQFVQAQHSTAGRLLDIGCATGNFLHRAQLSGWEVAGIEINPRAASIARQRYNVPVHASDLLDTDLSPDYFDAVTLWDVLEHLPNPRAALGKIHQILQRGGVVCFSIPNLASFDRHLFGTAWIGWDSPRHFNLFDDDTISKLFDETGFRLLEKKCLLGGKGTFQLSLDQVIHGRPRLAWIMRAYPIISAFLWPYRQLAYAAHRGPIMFYAAEVVKA